MENKNSARYWHFLFQHVSSSFFLIFVFKLKSFRKGNKKDIYAHILCYVYLKHMLILPPSFLLCKLE